MSTFSDLPRYPPASVDEPDDRMGADGAIHGAVAVAQVAGEILLLVSPLFACLWWIVCFPVLLTLAVATLARDRDA